jgi:NAD(P)-dependent dehydrogenase (short-subunit alcohol dehydrogenase family)
MTLTGRVAIVTGGGSGIGAATCRAFARAGASVAVTDLSVDAAATVAAGINEAGDVAAAYALNVADEDNVASVIARVVADFGGLDVVVNNAAGGLDNHGFGKTVETLDKAVFDSVIAVNLCGSFLMSKYAVPHLRARGGGSILFTSSRGGKQGTAGMAAYGATKAAIINLTQTMALDHAADGIRVNAVCPGAIATPGLLSGPNADHMAEMLAMSVPLHRLGEADEVADAFVFLASDAASYITGVALDIDGGIGAGRPAMPPPPGS